ncbi:MAG: SDR family oxidoreductase [bacterium]|nr:SDR family oxidoreductase [bacterium]
MAEANVLDQFKLDGKVALIVGGSKGLGKSMALGFAQAGATTVISARTAADCATTASELAGETGQESVAVAGDVTQEADVDRVFASVVEKFGRLDVVVNSAGINVRHLIENFPLDDFKRIMDINMTGVWLCCRAAARIMKPQGFGSVINVASALSGVGLAERSAYCASKAGLIGLTRTLAMEWASSGVRCNALCPGPFLTEINVPLLQEPEKVKGLLGLTALNRWAELEEIRGAGLFLASDASSFMTGASLYIDGGWTAH